MPAQLAMAFHAEAGLAAGREIAGKGIGDWKTGLVRFHFGLPYAFQWA